ncbi:MAG: hypothetical protein JSR54_03005 [Proteobacteria bacterium]|nr:hypothetical protein [Pseudomonadota bacterium]
MQRLFTLQGFTIEFVGAGIDVEIGRAEVPSRRFGPAGLRGRAMTFGAASSSNRRRPRLRRSWLLQRRSAGAAQRHLNPSSSAGTSAAATRRQAHACGGPPSPQVCRGPLGCGADVEPHAVASGQQYCVVRVAQREWRALCHPRSLRTGRRPSRGAEAADSHIDPCRSPIAAQPMRALSACMIAATAVATVSCATLQPPLRPTDLETAPPAIALLASPQAPSSNYASFSRGKGAARGAATGAAAGAAGSLFTGPLAPVLMPYLAVIGAAAGAGVGAIDAGGSGALPAQDAAIVERKIAAAANELRLAEKAVLAMADEARDVLPQTVVVLDTQTEFGRRAAATHKAPGYAGLLELRIAEIGFVGARGFSSDLAFFMTAEAKYFDAASGSLSLARGLVYQSDLRPPDHWSRDGARSLAAEIERGYRALAQRTVEAVLLGTDSDGTTLMGAPISSGRTCGLVPTDPAPRYDRFLLGQTHPVAVSADSVTPRLAWLPFVPRTGPGEPAQVRYDLRIWPGDGSQAAPIYERFGLTRAEHRVEVVLAPGALYLWSVRARVELHGRARALPWSAALQPRFEPHHDAARANYHSMTANGELREIRCPTSGALDGWFSPSVLWTPCRCLDFIPPRNYYRFVTPP